MRTAAISHSLAHGYQVEIIEVPLRWLLVEHAGELFLTLTGHVICCNQPGWTYRVRWGPTDDEDWTDRSLGYQLHRAGQWLACITFRHEKRMAAIEVTPDWVQEHFPEIRGEFRFLEDGPDAMSVSFSG
jgi:hypothetical protein